MARKHRTRQHAPRPQHAAAGSAPGEASPQEMDRLAARVEQALQAQRSPDEQGQTRLRQAQQQVEQARGALAQEQERLSRQGPELMRELPAQQVSGGVLERLRRGIAKTRDSLAAGLGRLVPGGAVPAPALLKGLEEVLLAADVGPVTTARLLAALRERLRRSELNDAARLKAAIREEVLRVVQRPFPPPRLEQVLAARAPAGAGGAPAVLLLVGVNGSGKTTTLGKLAALHVAQGRKVLLAAGDTFRAAAAEQLAEWAARSGSAIFIKPPGTEPSAVMFQALHQALAQGVDLVLCDTAGRLHTKVNLMEELKKVQRVMAKVIPGAPHETWLVLDANTGQNAIHQTRQFHQALGLTGLIVTKLDGTARGGVIIGISNEFDIPVRYIGVGEAVEDLRPFDPAAFVESLFE